MHVAAVDVVLAVAIGLREEDNGVGKLSSKGGFADENRSLIAIRQRQRFAVDRVERHRQASINHRVDALRRLPSHDATRQTLHRGRLMADDLERVVDAVKEGAGWVKKLPSKVGSQYLGGEWLANKNVVVDMDGVRPSDLERLKLRNVAHVVKLGGDRWQLLYATNPEV